MTENTSTSPFHTLTPAEVMARLGVGPDGLAPGQALARLEQYGPNQLAQAKKISPLAILVRQFKNVLIVILIIAAVVSLALGEYLDAWVILAILLACALLGFYQEYNAEKAAAALHKLAAPTATVVRQGQEEIIPAAAVVPGDLLVLHTGDRVAADGRLLEQVNLKADEAIITGESTAVGKELAAIAQPDAPLGERRSLVFAGAVITYGRGLAVVTATGMDTEFGRIARLLGETPHEATPLETRMAGIGRVLGGLGLMVAVGASLLGVLRGHGWLEMLLWGLSLAVAAVPEALPAVVTGALSLGAARMARQKAIVKRLPAVETMGCTQVICTDKTGTLTKNEMTVRRLYIDGRQIEVTGSGYAPLGALVEHGREIHGAADPLLELAATIGVLCNDAALEEIDQQWTIRGDPTEAALLVWPRKAGFDLALLAADLPRVGEIPFSAEAKRMSTVHQAGPAHFMCLKGAPESLLPRCRRLASAGGEVELTEAHQADIRSKAAGMAQEALRVLGLAYRLHPTMPDLESGEADQDLVWVALVGMMDPPRPEALDAVARCHRAGIRVLMVTGDHPDTAQAIAGEIGICPSGHEARVLTGPQLNQLSAPQLRQALAEVRVFARVNPEHKLRLVQALKEQGQVVAMTGDGVNDAPALKRADIGVAMGITGTEVTKETADMILADDNFATLVAAVEEGRAIFDNIKKYLIFLLSGNLAEIMVLTGAFFLGLPLPLIALQILWVNLTTDGLPALALGVDPKAFDLMSRPPRPAAEGMFTRPVLLLLGVMAGWLTLILMGLFACYSLFNPRGLVDPAQALILAQTMVFVTLVLAEMANAFNCRSERLSIFKAGIRSNKFLLAAVLISLGMMAAVIQWPPLAGLFHVTPLVWQEWAMAAGLALTIIPVVEAAKWWLRRNGRTSV